VTRGRGDKETRRLKRRACRKGGAPFFIFREEAVSFSTLFAMLGPAVGLALAVAAMVMAVCVVALWKARDRDRWMGAVMPVALAAGFCSGYAKLFDIPVTWDDEIWKWTVVSAALAGVLLAVGAILPREASWFAWGFLAVTVAWMTARRIPESREYFMAALGGGLILYVGAFCGAVREAGTRAVGPLIMLLCGMAGVGLVMPFEMNMGRMFFVLTALAGLCVVTGVARPLRSMAAGGTAFVAVMFGVLVTLAAVYMAPETYPRSVFWWMAAAPLGMAVAWAPWLRKRPWWCAIAAVAVTGALLVPAIVIAMKNAPPMDV
jgi:hypothetical protein